MCDEQETVYKSYTLSHEVEYASMTVKTYPFGPPTWFPRKQYKIVNYDKKRINERVEPGVGKYRSVIFSENVPSNGISFYPMTKLLCFSPPKSITIDEFSDRHSEFDPATMTIEETVEGTMISLFYNSETEQWEIATKGAVSGNYYFFRTEYLNAEKTQNTTFRKMFLDALKYDIVNVERYERTAKDVNLQEIPFIAALPTNYCYNFVVQHPENHIVNHAEFPRLVLISVYNVVGDELRAVNIPRAVYSEWDCFRNSVVEFPEIFTQELGINPMTYWSINSQWGSIHCPTSCLGATITHYGSGDRTRVDNPAYTALRELRGNNANLQYHYLCLIRMGKLDEFLTHFPAYVPVMSRFAKQYQAFAKNIHNCYVSHYALKNRDPIAPKFKTHTYRLHHEVYLPSLNRFNADTRPYAPEFHKLDMYKPAPVVGSGTSDSPIELKVEPVQEYKASIRFITLKEVHAYLLDIEPRHMLYNLNSPE